MKILVLTNQYPEETNPLANPVIYNQVHGLRKLGVDVDVFFINSSEKGIITYVSSFFPLRKKWLSAEYDLLHIQFGGFLALFGVLIAGRQSVVTYHGSDLHGGSPSSFSGKVKSIVNVCCSRLAADISGNITAVSSSLVQYLPKSAQQKVVVLPLGVDYQVFYPQDQYLARQKLGLNPEEKYVLFSDISGSSVKRRDIALSVIQKLNESGIKVNLLVLSKQPYSCVPLYLNSADCLLLTSDKEGSPNIIREAIAVELPIVSVDVGDVREQCQGVKNCRVVPRDLDELVLTVAEVLKVDRIGGGREEKRSTFDNQIICEKLVQRYNQFIKR